MATKAELQKKLAEVLDVFKRPTPPEAIKTRPGKGSSGPLRYVDARYVMERLDEAVGPFGWSDSYLETAGGVICTISISLDGEAWVHKSDVGTPSKIEPVKGRYSDAFKRAAVKWGIGRDLYEDPAPAADTAPEPEQAPKVVGGSGLTPKQKRFMFAKMKEHDITGDRRKALLFFVCNLKGEGLTAQMTGKDLDKVVAFLDAGPEADPETWENIMLADAG